MNIIRVEHEQQHYAAGLPDQPLLQTVDDTRGIIEYCWEHEIDRVLLYAANLPARFFDLSSQEAGLVLQKFSTYRIKLAVVVDLDTTPHSRRFAELVAEEQQGHAFHVARTSAEAEAWLVQDP